MASPLQGSWVIGNILKDISSLTGERIFPDPLKVLSMLGLQLMGERFSVWDAQISNHATAAFRSQFEDMYKAGVSRESGRTQSNFPLDHSVHSVTGGHVHKFQSPAVGPLVPPISLDSSAASCTEAPVASDISPIASVMPQPDLPTAAICAPASDAGVSSIASVPNSVAAVAHHAPAPPAGVPSVGSAIVDCTAVQSTCHSTNGSVVASTPEQASTTTKTCKLSDRLVDFAPGSWTLPNEPSSLQADPYTSNGALVISGNKRKIDQVENSSIDPIESFSEDEDAESLILTTQVDSISQGSAIDTSNIEAIRDAIDALESPKPSHVVLDLSQHENDRRSVSPTIEWTQKVDSFRYRHPGGISDKEYYSTGIWICFLHEAPLHVIIEEGTKIDSLIKAHLDFVQIGEPLQPYSEFGLQIDSSHVLVDKQTIFLLTPAQATQRFGSTTASSLEPPCLGHLCRDAALWNQFGWVAEDEMKYYLWMFDREPHPTTPPIFFLDRPDDPILLGNWIMSAIEQACQSNDIYRVGTVCWRNNHWFPLVVKICPEPNSISLCVSEDQADFVTDLLSNAFGTDWNFDLSSIDLPQVFPFDCGFQSYASVRYILQEGQSPFISPAEARRWRAGFASYVRSNGLDVPTSHLLRFGGTPEAGVKTELTKLLEQHGVSPNRSAQATLQLISTIGLTSLASTLSSPRPWADPNCSC